MRFLCNDNNRARIRVRFGFEGKLNEDFVGGVALATTRGDPTTTNETLTNNFDRKTIALDRGFITYNPTYAKWFSATAGKFAYTWAGTFFDLRSGHQPRYFRGEVFEGFRQRADGEERQRAVHAIAV